MHRLQNTRKLILLLSLALGLAASGAFGASGLSVSNEFARIRVNPGPHEGGRFAVDTTGGDPSRASDNEQPLIYGSSEPWTSYTTLLIHGKPMLFGGETGRRAGKDVPAGTVVEGPKVEGEAIVTVARLGEIEVRQELAFSRNPTTRVKDAAKISYLVTNRGETEVPVGLRVVLDTMLGANDGAALRAGENAITKATQLKGDALPDYWQAFDSLSSPAVISQGALRGPGLTPPTRMAMVDWGTLADNPWDFPFPEGADFTRAGEEEQDTAVALYWDPEPLAPGKSRSYATLYGVGGISLSPAQLSLGLTAPAEIDYQYEDTRSFAVVAYLENSGGYEARAAKCALELPKGLKLEQGEATSSLGVVKPGETRQLAWRVIPTGQASGPLKLSVAITSENLDPNQVTREVIVNSPPKIEVSIAGPKSLDVTANNRYRPNPFPLKVTATNRGAQLGRNVLVSLALPEGMKLIGDTAALQVVERLGTDESKQFTWMVQATGMPTGNLTLGVTATAAGAKPTQATHTVAVPLLTPELRLYPATQVVPLKNEDGEPTLVPVDVLLAPARDFRGTRVSLHYDPAVLEPLYVRRGEAFVDAGRLLAPWSAGRMGEGIVAEIGGERTDAPLLNAAETQVLRIVFIARGPGETDLTLEPTNMLGPGGKPIVHRVLTGHIVVQSPEEEPK